MKTLAYNHSHTPRVPYTNNGGSAINSGDVVVVVSGSSGYIGIAVDAIAASGGTGVIEDGNAHALTKNTGEAFTAGQVIYWDATNKRLTGHSTGNTRAGRADGAYASAATSATVLVNQP